MTPVLQASKVDCLSACIASILDIPLPDVPSFWEFTGEEWLDAIKRWARSRGLGVCYFSLQNRKDWPVVDNFYLIVAGPTHRSTEYFHAVVARAVSNNGQTRLDYIHDPCPDGGFLNGEPDHCLFFVPDGSNGNSGS